MEKVIIQTCVKKETQKGVFYTIELSDGRKGISSDDFTQKMGMEIEIDVKPGKEYQGVMQYYFNLPKENKPQGNGKFAPKDWTYEKRKVSLECAVSHCSKKPELTTEQVIQVATKFFEYLNQK